MITGMNADEIKEAAQARIEELQPFYDEYLALQRMITDFEQETVVSSPAITSYNGRRTYAGRRSLPDFLVDLMQDRKRRTLDEIEQAVQMAPEFEGRVPSRNTIATRLNELFRKPGTFEKLPDGSYQK
jgi:hypothetical protein